MRVVSNKHCLLTFFIATIASFPVSTWVKVPQIFWVLGLTVYVQCSSFIQGLHRLEKYLNLEGFLEKSLKIKYAL